MYTELKLSFPICMYQIATVPMYQAMNIGNSLISQASWEIVEKSSGLSHILWNISPRVFFDFEVQCANEWSTLLFRISKKHYIHKKLKTISWKKNFDFALQVFTEIFVGIEIGFGIDSVWIGLVTWKTRRVEDVWWIGGVTAAVLTGVALGSDVRNWAGVAVGFCIETGIEMWIFGQSFSFLWKPSGSLLISIVKGGRICSWCSAFRKNLIRFRYCCSNDPGLNFLKIGWLSASRFGRELIFSGSRKRNSQLSLSYQIFQPIILWLGLIWIVSIYQMKNLDLVTDWTGFLSYPVRFVLATILKADSTSCH